MSYSQLLKKRFPEIALQWEDLFLLESFQIGYLPDRVPEKEFSILLHAYPEVHSFLVSKHPPITSFLEKILQENRADEDSDQVEQQCQEALWEIGDLIIYNKYPEQFDEHAPIKWEIDEIKIITPLEGKVVADVGAGTGRIAFLVAPWVHTIYAVEPLSRFRAYMKAKATETGVPNMFIMDGMLNSIPLPDNSLDILITSNALGWNLDEELTEIERVVRPNGHAIHLLQSDVQKEVSFHEILISSPWEYTCLEDEKKNGMKFRYFKKI